MRAFKYFVTEAAASLWRGRRSAILAILTIAAGLFVLGFFLGKCTDFSQSILHPFCNGEFQFTLGIIKFTLFLDEIGLRFLRFSQFFITEFKQLL